MTKHFAILLFPPFFSAAGCLVKLLFYIKSEAVRRTIDYAAEFLSLPTPPFIYTAPNRPWTLNAHVSQEQMCRFCECEVTLVRPDMLTF